MSKSGQRRRGAICHDILHFCARVLASSRVSAQDSNAALLDVRGCRDV